VPTLLAGELFEFGDSLTQVPDFLVALGVQFVSFFGRLLEGGDGFRAAG